MPRLQKYHSLKIFMLLAWVFLFGQLANALHDNNDTDHDHGHTCSACLHTINDQTDADQDDSLDDPIDTDLFILSQHESRDVKSDLTLSNRTSTIPSPKHYLPLSRGPPKTYS